MPSTRWCRVLEIPSAQVLPQEDWERGSPLAALLELIVQLYGVVIQKLDRVVYKRCPQLYRVVY